MPRSIDRVPGIPGGKEQEATLKASARIKKPGDLAKGIRIF